MYDGDPGGPIAGWDWLNGFWSLTHDGLSDCWDVNDFVVAESEFVFFNELWGFAVVALNSFFVLTGALVALLVKPGLDFGSFCFGSAGGCWYCCLGNGGGDCCCCWLKVGLGWVCCCLKPAGVFLFAGGGGGRLGCCCCCGAGLLRVDFLLCSCAARAQGSQWGSPFTL